MRKYRIAIAVLMMTLFFSCVNDESSNSNVGLNEEHNLIRMDTIRNAADEIEKVETYFDDKISSVSFFSKNRVRKVLKYIEWEGEMVTNELFVINANGDTLKDESLYHGVYCVNDTIYADEDYTFKIVLEGHLYENAYLALSDINEGFPIKSGSSSVVEMENFEGPRLAIKGKQKGWNYIRGRIDNVRKLSKQNDSVRWSSVYFIDSFYVK